MQPRRVRKGEGFSLRMVVAACEAILAKIDERGHPQREWYEALPVAVQFRIANGGFLRFDSIESIEADREGLSVLITVKGAPPSGRGCEAYEPHEGVRDDEAAPSSRYEETMERSHRALDEAEQRDNAIREGPHGLLGEP